MTVSMYDVVTFKDCDVTSKKVEKLEESSKKVDLIIAT